MSESTNGPLPRSEFWQRAAAVAFGLWAISIPLGISMLRDSFSVSSAAATRLTEKVSEDVSTTAARMASFEARQQLVLARIEVLERKVDDLRVTCRR